MRSAIVGLSALIFVASSIVTTSGCSQKKEDDGTSPMVITKELPALTIRDDTPQLLLTWIDDFLDAHESPLERTLGRAENALAATRLVPVEIRSRVMFKTFGDGSAVDSTRWRVPTRHGDFSNPRLRFWEPEFWMPRGGSPDSSAVGG